jgi:hypothetical protein
MKSERQATRIAFFCSPVGLRSVPAWDETGGLACAGSDFLGWGVCSLCPLSAGDDGGTRSDRDAMAARQGGDSPAAFAFRQSITSGLLG